MQRPLCRTRGIVRRHDDDRNPEAVRERAHGILRPSQFRHDDRIERLSLGRPAEMLREFERSRLARRRERRILVVRI